MAAAMAETSSVFLNILLFLVQAFDGHRP